MMGYQAGLSLFPLPYDWRHRSGSNDVKAFFQRTVGYSHLLNDKKAIVITHSFGSLNALVALNELSS